MGDIWVTGGGDWTGIAQVVVAVLGFGAAIGVPWFQKRNDTRLRRNDTIRKARALAFVLRPILENWLTLLWETNESTRDADPRYAIREFFSAVVRTKALDVPPPLRNRVEDLYVLNWVADHLFEAMNAAHEGDALSKLVESQEFDPDQTSGGQDAYDEVRQKMIYVEKKIAVALSEIVELIDADGAKRLEKLVNS